MIKIICEAGCNWRTLDEAFQFIDESKRLGLFATKFQLFEEKQIQEADPNIQDFLRTIQLTYDDAKDLFEYGQKIGQEVFFTPMFLKAVEWCERIRVKYYKVRFADFSNKKILSKIIETEKPFFRSRNTGLIEGIYPLEKPFFCIHEYPANIWDYLRKLNIIANLSGISDHTNSLRLFQIARLIPYFSIIYFEKHMMLDSYTDALEKDWSVTFSQLEEVLNK